MALVLTVGTGPVAGFQAQTPGPAAHPEHTFAKILTLPGVPNFGEVTEQLYRGGQPTADGFKELVRRGVGIVIDLRGGEGERAQVTKLGMQYVSIPWHCFNPQNERFAQFLQVIRENPDKKIFVHCRLGVDRTGMMIASYRMGEQGWNAGEAAREMAAFGFSSMHHMICPGLATYEANFPRQLQNSPAFKSLRPSEHSSK